MKKEEGLLDALPELERGQGLNMRFGNFNKNTMKIISQKIKRI